METGIKDFARPVEASAIKELLPSRPRVLALGEPTHGEDTLLDLRNTLFRQLVEQEGYRTIALETDCLKALIVDAYVTSGEGALDDVMRRGFSHDWGGSQANRELIRWIREFNAARPADDHVRFAGMDGPWRSQAPKARARPSPRCTPTWPPTSTRTCCPARRTGSTSCSAPTRPGPTRRP